MSETKVENVKDFLDKLIEIQKSKSDNTELFFRGHADRAYEAEPTIFRKNGNGERNLLKNEKHLFNDMITQCPEDFKDCQYTFEYLVKMQHYGLPTRLLDITSNALVALYFACCSLQGEKDGQVLVYAVRKDIIKNYNSDTASVLSNLAQLDSDFEVLIKGKKDMLDENEELLIILESIIKNYDFCERLIEDRKNKHNSNRDNFGLSLSKHGLNTDEFVSIFNLRKEEIKNEMIRFVKNYKNKRKYKMLWNNIYLLDDEDIHIEYAKALIKTELKGLKILQDLRNKQKRFLHFIKQEKSYFIDKIDDEKDVQKIICVRAKLNNQRIIRQNGLFFLFGMGRKKGEPITFSEYINELALEERNKQEKVDLPIQEIINPTIIISAEKKNDILKELRNLGISKETLMPEIDTVASTLKDRYN